MEITTFEKAVELQEQIKVVKRDLASIEKLTHTEHSPHIAVTMTDIETFAAFCFNGKRDWVAAKILAMFKEDLETKLKSLQDEFDNL